MNFTQDPWTAYFGRQCAVRKKPSNLGAQNHHPPPEYKCDGYGGPPRSEPYTKRARTHIVRLTRNMYPSPRTVTIRLATGPNFSRRRLTCVSTVRVSIAFSYPHTSWSKVSLERVLPRRSTRRASNLNSVVVSRKGLPLRSISKFPLSMQNSSTLTREGLRTERSRLNTFWTLKTNSRGLKGFVI